MQLVASLQPDIHAQAEHLDKPTQPADFDLRAQHAGETTGAGTQLLALLVQKYEY
jgi:hypothetical protein